MYWQLQVLTKQSRLCHGKMLRPEGVPGAFAASEVCPELSLRCWGDRTLGFFHDTHVTLRVWFIQYALAAPGGFCGSYSAAGAEAQTMPGLHSKHNVHGEETNIKNLFSHVKDDIVLQLLVLPHFVPGVCQLGVLEGVYSRHTYRKQVQITWRTHTHPVALTAKDGWTDSAVTLANIPTTEVTGVGSLAPASKDPCVTRLRRTGNSSSIAFSCF